LYLLYSANKSECTDRRRPLAPDCAFAGRVPGDGTGHDFAEAGKAERGYMRDSFKEGST
jgi:hypothetical protein